MAQMNNPGSRVLSSNKPDEKKEEGEGDHKAAAKFFAVLLNAITIAHVMHLQQTGPGSCARHTALGELYEGLGGLVDSLIEAYQGCEDVLIEEYPFSPIEIPKDAMTGIDMLYEYVEGARAGVSDESHIQNEIDAICTLISTTRYKLKRLA